MTLEGHLARLAPFDRLGPRAVAAAVRLAEPAALRTGKALCWQGDRADHCWLLLEGQVRAVMYRSDESTIELGHSGRGDWLGLAELLLESPYLADSTADRPCELAAFSRAGLLQLMELPGVQHSLLRELARRYYTLHARMELKTPRDRIVRLLVERCGGSPGEIACTQEEIAEAIGVTRETVNRHLGELAAEGLVRIGRGVLQVPDPSRLRPPLP